MSGHQGHRRILLAFIIIIAMLTGKVQYYHLHRRLRHCFLLRPPLPLQLFLAFPSMLATHLRSIRPRFWFCLAILCPGTLMFRLLLYNLFG